MIIMTAGFDDFQYFEGGIDDFVQSDLCKKRIEMIESQQRAAHSDLEGLEDEDMSISSSSD